MFNPDLNGHELMGLPSLVDAVLAECPLDSRSQMLNDGVLLNGGNVMFPGMCERLQKELVSLGWKNHFHEPPKVFTLKSRSPMEGAFYGAVIMAAMMTDGGGGAYEDYWVTTD